VEAHILVVDDDVAIRELIHEYLTENDFKVSVAETGADMDRVLSVEVVDLVILDLKLPDEDGLAIARRLRESLDLPIIILTGRKEEVDRVMGLELGADDYVTKPFSPRELVLRVSAVLRRAQSPAVAGGGRMLRGGPIAVDLNALRVSVNGDEIELTPTEYRLLVTLLERRGRVQSRQQLLENAWDIHARIETRTVDMHVQRLRTKLGVHGDLIETVRGFGYRFRARDEA
jgi:two-component system phosphate regulon response regulator PhoB